MMNDITGVILAGGKSTRMGENKAFVPFAGKPIIEILIGRLSDIFKDVIIIANKPEPYLKYGLDVIKDAVKPCGPLGGIYTALTFSKTRLNFVVACDMPFFNKDIARFMVNEASRYDAVIPRHAGRLEPLCAVYSENCIAPIEKEITAGNAKVTSFISEVKTRIVDESEIARFDLDCNAFTNVNTRDDYRLLQEEDDKSGILT